jgi:hypothetical protein
MVLIATTGCRSCSRRKIGSFGSTPEDRKSLLRAFPANDMRAWPVGAAVGNVKNTGPELVERIASPAA